MTILYAGWTPTVKTPRDLAIERLDKVAAQMSAEDFQVWLEDIARTATKVDDFRYAADNWLADDCHHCGDAMCKCTYKSEIPY